MLLHSDRKNISAITTIIPISQASLLMINKLFYDAKIPRQTEEKFQILRI